MRTEEEIKKEIERLKEVKQTKYDHIERIRSDADELDHTICNLRWVLGSVEA